MRFNRQWIVTGESVTGAKHRQAGLPNQDAFDCGYQAGNLVIALSDGHGSQKHFRSHLGAQFAVQTAVETILREADVDYLTSQMLPQLRERVADKLPQRIVTAWEKRVKQHYTRQPFSKQELSELEAAKGKQVRDEVAENPVKAYGATILAVLITEQFILYLQLGDGDILLVTDQDVERAFTSDEIEELGPATNSLCMSDPEIYFELSFQLLDEQCPDLIMVATDGYINSFPYDRDFFQVGSDFLTLAAEDGIAYIEDKLEDWLLKTSQEGSGDDITVGLIWSREVK